MLEHIQNEEPIETEAATNTASSTLFYGFRETLTVSLNTHLRPRRLLPDTLNPQPLNPKP